MRFSQLLHGNMRCAAKQLALGDAHPARDHVEANCLGLTERSLAVRAVAVDPFDVVYSLTGGLY